MQSPDTGRSAAIDGLSALAVLAVIVFHLDRIPLPGGLAGIDALFVISGFMTCRSLSAQPVQRAWPWMLDFYRRRVLRMLPLLLLVIVATFAVATWRLPRGSIDGTYENTGLAAMFGLSNLVLAWGPASFFTRYAAGNPFLQTWPLALQMQFFVLVPPLLYHWRDPRPARWLLGLLALASFLLAAWQTTMLPASAYYLLPARFWEFAAGVLLYLCVDRPRQPTALRHAGWLGLVLLLADMLVVRPGGLPFADHVIAVTATLLVLAACSLDPPGKASLLTRVLSCAPLRYLGRLSFAIYLVHWPVLVFMRDSQTLSQPELWLYLPIVLILALTLHYAIEQPLGNRHWRWQAQPQQVFSTALTATAISAAVVAILGYQ